MDFDWKKIVSSVAPFIGGTLIGPMGATAMQAIAEKLTGNKNATEVEIEKAVLAATPEQLAELKKLDHDFKVKMKELGFKEKELHAKDRHSARELASKNMAPQVIISALYTAGYFVLLYQLTKGNINIAESAIALMNTLMGVMTAAQVQIMNFWFGSSSGSKDKDAIAKGSV